MPFSPQTNPSQTPTRPPKRPFSNNTLPASGWPISKKSCKQPDIKTKMSLPPLPPVQSDAALTIFVHSTLKSPVPNERFGDVERLAFIGRHVLSMAIAESFFEKRPMLGAVELEVMCFWLPLIFNLCMALIRTHQSATDRASGGDVGRFLRPVGDPIQDAGEGCLSR
jgi:hypothetical protein